MKKRLVLLDSFRALMPLLILMFHMSWGFEERFGYSVFNMHLFEKTGGVDLFFVLSGFLMFYLYGHRAGEEGLAEKFIVKRLLRILPMYYLVLLVTLMVVGDWNWVFVMQNILLVPGSHIIGPAWSLSHTMLFYIFFALYLKKPREMTLVSLFLFVISISGTGYTFIELLPNLGVLEFLFDHSNSLFFFGIAGAIYVQRYPMKRPVLPIFIGLGGYGFIWSNYTYDFLELNITLFYGLFAVLLLMGAASLDLKRDIKMPKAVLMIANASFVVYLIHEQLLGYVMDWSHQLIDNGIIVFVMVTGIILLISILIHLFVERNLNKLISGAFERISIPKALKYSLVTLALVLFVSFPMGYGEESSFYSSEVFEGDGEHTLVILVPENELFHEVVEEEWDEDLSVIVFAHPVAYDLMEQAYYHLDDLEDEISEGVLELLWDNDLNDESVFVIAGDEVEWIHEKYQTFNDDIDL